MTTTTFGERLHALADTFRRLKTSRSGLYLEEYRSHRVMTESRWQAIQAKERRAARATRTVEDWDLYPDDQRIARFFGSLDGYSAFQNAGQEAYHLLCETDPSLDKGDSYYGWLRILVEMAVSSPSERLRAKQRLIERPAKVRASRLVQDVFTASLAAIDRFLEPYAYTPLTPMLWADVATYPLLQPWQLQAVVSNPLLLKVHPAEIAASGLRDAVMTIGRAPLGDSVPRFHDNPGGGGRLLVGHHVVRNVRCNSPVLTRILREFERQRWKRTIPNPFVAEVGRVIDEELKKGREFARKMRDCQSGPPWVAFSAPNSGRRISWEICHS